MHDQLEIHGELDTPLLMSMNFCRGYDGGDMPWGFVRGIVRIELAPGLECIWQQMVLQSDHVLLLMLILRLELMYACNDFIDTCRG